MISKILALRLISTLKRVAQGIERANDLAHARMEREFPPIKDSEVYPKKAVFTKFKRRDEDDAS